MSDTISRQAAIDALKNRWKKTRNYEGNGDDIAEECELYLKQVPSAQPEIIHCGDCKYFELDHFEKVDEFPIPIIVAHEICMKWSGGCRTSIDGWCFMAERRTDETD